MLRNTSTLSILAACKHGIGNNQNMSATNLSIELRDSLAQIDAAHWNALSDTDYPFQQYEFLYALESGGCLGRHNGWYPRYFLLWRNEAEEKKLVGAMPAYLKTNSYGEFVFDWAWAEAYERHNFPYYPKLVCAIPFTPATGQRILVHKSMPREESMTMLINAAKQYCHSEEYSGVHWLFITDEENTLLTVNDDQQPTDEEPDESEDAPTALNSLQRIDCQYHWHNNDYQNFEDFLSQCTSKRRKTIKRERRHVADAAIRVEKRSGKSLSDEEWESVHLLYESTYDRKWGNPSLTLDFFKQIGATFGGNVLIILAYNAEDSEPDKPIACSIMFHGKSVLYGRYWGCRAQHNSLHFEACYYQGIEFCIENGISMFEPGAQGEHKITRGFVPTITRSAHYIAHPGFREAIAEFLNEERQHVEQRREGLSELLPFKHQHLDALALTSNESLAEASSTDNRTGKHKRGSKTK